ncbi:hypothetical protein LINPERHAP2_LOCUS15761, partial [Linum perenne]
MSMMLEEDINFIETSFPNDFRKRCQKHYTLTKMNKHWHCTLYLVNHFHVLSNTRVVLSMV